VRWVRIPNPKQSYIGCKVHCSLDVNYIIYFLIKEGVNYPEFSSAIHEKREKTRKGELASQNLLFFKKEKDS
jgi:hypothetical protein